MVHVGKEPSEGTFRVMDPPPTNIYCNICTVPPALRPADAQQFHPGSQSPSLVLLLFCPFPAGT